MFNFLETEKKVIKEIVKIRTKLMCRYFEQLYIDEIEP